MSTQKHRSKTWQSQYSALLSAAMKDLNLEQDTTDLILGAVRAQQWQKLLVLADGVDRQCTSAITDFDLSDDPVVKGLARDRFYRYSQLFSFIKKVPLPCDLSPKEEATRRFYAAEHACKRTNQRLRAARFVGRNPYKTYFDLMNKFIVRVMGESPPLRAIYSRCRFGPGTSVGLTGNATHLINKMRNLSVTPSAVPFAMGALWDHSHMRDLVLTNDTVGSNSTHVCYDPIAFRERCERLFDEVNHNNIAFVPKTAKTDRTIAAEPVLNGFLQLGVDSWLKDRLETVGVTLRDDHKNRGLAWQGTLGGPNPFVTIDLSMASDSLSIQLVKELLPPEWFSFLDAIRSPSFKMPEDLSSHRYEKFVSMGNGFCFPLQSLIFAAAVHAVTGCAQHEFAVFGDDIIVRQSDALLLIELLRYMGFKHNVDKTFVFGSFRESCGGDYLGGVNVRPFVLDYLPENSRDLIKIANGVRTLFSDLPSVRDTCIELLPQKDKLLSPVPVSPDAAIYVDFERFLVSKFSRWERDEQCWSWVEFRDNPVLDKESLLFNNKEEMLAVLGGAVSADGKPLFALRRKTKTRRVRTTTLARNSSLKHDTVLRVLTDGNR